MRCFTTNGYPVRVATNFPHFSGNLFYLTMLLVFLGFSNRSLRAQAEVTAVTFTQFDRYGTDNKLLFQNSSLGQFSFSATPDQKSMYYLNILAKTTTGKEAWIVQNLPVAADIDAVPITCQSVNVDFKLLEVRPGILVDKVEYSVNLSPRLLTVKNPVPVFLRAGENPSMAIIKANQFSSANAAFGAPVATSYTAAPVIRGTLLHELSGDYSETKDVALYANASPIAAPAAKDRDIPGDLEEDPNGCGPGAFARSIAWLSTQPNFRAAVPLKPKDIYDTLKKLMDTCKTFECQIQKKADYLKGITGGRGTTTDHFIPGPKSPADIIKDNPDCDIELYMYPPPGGKLGHLITIVGITCGDDGCCTITYRDDSAQGKPGGDKCVKTAKICGTTITFEGVKRNIGGIITECVSAANRVVTETEVKDDVILLGNVPNPFGNSTVLRVEVKKTGGFKTATLAIRNDQGTELRRIKLNLQKGINEVRYQPERNAKGILYCTLEVDGQVVGSQKMFAR